MSGTAPFRPCAVVPTYENPLTVRGVVERVREHLPVILVDDGSGPDGCSACRELADEGLVALRRLEVNSGKGAAVWEGLRFAGEQGYTHALQVDADGQHDLSRIPAFLEASVAAPDALVIAYPVYDETVPRIRERARGITRFWVDLEVGRGRVRDTLIGFRVYPIASTLGLRAGDRMEFDVEIVVRLLWAGVPAVNLPVGVRYLTAEEGGVSHFRPIASNLRLAWMHSRLCTWGICRWFLRRLGLAA